MCMWNFGREKPLFSIARFEIISVFSMPGGGVARHFAKAEGIFANNGACVQENNLSKHR